jgi:hypothetical protein
MKDTTLSPVIKNVWDSIFHISFDVAVTLFLFFIFTALAFYFGKSKSVALIISSYIALFLFAYPPFIKQGTVEPLVVLGAFLILWFAIFFLIKNVISTEYPFALFHKLLEVGLLAISFLIIILVAFHRLLPIGTIYRFSSLTISFFGPVQYIFYWLLLPFVITLYISRR